MIQRILKFLMGRIVFLIFHYFISTAKAEPVSIETQANLTLSMQLLFLELTK
jgi:hypothetical protein